MNRLLFFLLFSAAVLLAGGCATAVMSGAADGGNDWPAAAQADARITRSIRTLIYRDELLAGARIHVSTHDGVVTLHGEVGSAEERRRAQVIADRVAGVRAINNELRVQDTP